MPQPMNMISLPPSGLLRNHYAHITGGGLADQAALQSAASGSRVGHTRPAHSPLADELARQQVRFRLRHDPGTPH